MRGNEARSLRPDADADRRRSQRFDVTLDVKIRFLPDGTPISGAATEVGPNGMRLLTSIPLVEASYVHVSFDTASNNTFCEGRVVWTQTGRSGRFYESGVDIQRWGGGTPPISGSEIPNLKPKRDRRKRPR